MQRSSKASKAAASEVARPHQPTHLRHLPLRQHHLHRPLHPKVAHHSIPPVTQTWVTARAGSSSVDSASAMPIAEADAAPAHLVSALGLVRRRKMERLVVDSQRRGPSTFQGVATTSWMRSTKGCSRSRRVSHKPSFQRLFLSLRPLPIALPVTLCEEQLVAGVAEDS